MDNKKQSKPFAEFISNWTWRYTRIVGFGIISLLGGLILLFDPSSVSDYLIRLVGFVWIVEGLGYLWNIFVEYSLMETQREIEALEAQIEDAKNVRKRLTRNLKVDTTNMSPQEINKLIYETIHGMDTGDSTTFFTNTQQKEE